MGTDSLFRLGRFSGIKSLKWRKRSQSPFFRNIGRGWASELHATLYKFLSAFLRLAQCRGLVVGDELLALGPKAQVRLGFLVKPLPVILVEHGLADDAPGSFGTEVIFTVEALHPIDHLGFVQNAGVDDV